MESPKELVKRRWAAVEVRHGQRDSQDVLRLYPTLEVKIRAATAELYAAHHVYVSSVSNPVWAASLQASACVLALCRLHRAQRIADFGSGFSSYVLRLYASTCETEVDVVSVDDDLGWLKETRSFLLEKGLPTSGLVQLDELPALPSDGYDVTFFDIGHTPLRNEIAKNVLSSARSGGLVVVDDVHRHFYRTRIRRLARRMRFQHHSLREFTLDGFGRYAELLVKN